jgi:precorrin-6A/cobalt-precorrin-6A reductase
VTGSASARVLILGGTAEAREIAERAAGSAPGRVILSLAGRTTAARAGLERPVPLVRRGGFGGVDGLVRWLEAERIAAVLDATHPFATQIQAHARAACARCAIPRLRLERPDWPQTPEDRWLQVDSARAAARACTALPGRILLTIGHRGLEAFAPLAPRLVVRTIEPPEALPEGAALILARGPFSLASELALLRDQRIGVVVAKQSGGEGARAKILAARALSLPVVLITRPDPVDAAPVVADVAAALAWLEARLAAPGWPQHVAVAAGIEPAVGERLGGEAVAHQDQRGPGEAGRLHLRADVGEGPA